MIARIGIHGSVAELFPPSLLADALGDLDVDVRVVETRAVLGDCDALVTFGYDPGFLEADLDWIHVVLAGVDHFPLAALRGRGVTVTNSTGIHGDSVGETVAGYMLSFARRLHVHRSNEPVRGWEYPDWDEAFTLHGESLCVVGLGTLGRGIAARADALGMRVSGVKRTPKPVDHVESVYAPAALHDAVRDARFVALAVPLTEATEALFGAPEFAAMREDAYLVNVARGGVVDQDALVAALDAGDLAGAALDVFAEEPLPEDSPLWDAPNVIVTPHAAGANREYYRRVERLVRENLRRLEADEALANRVV